MIVKKSLLVVALALFCLTVLVFSAIPAIGQTGEYDPWLDVNDDGYIGIDDIFNVASHFAGEGMPIAKASLLYDSGWINITDKCGQNVTIAHNLNSTDVIVDITGKTTIDGGIHQRHLGLTDYASGWSKTYGGASDDSGQFIAQTLDGGYIILGSTRSSGAGGNDFWLIKTDHCGHVEWDKTYGGPNNDQPYAVIQTTDGGYAMVGHTMSLGAGEEDFWLIKTDRFGNEQWNRTYGGPSQDIAYSVVQTSDNGFALAGQTWSFAVGWSNAWLIKTDEFGNAEWNKTYSRTNYDPAYSLIRTSDNGYAMAGRTASQQSFGDGDFWLIKTDSSGNVQWNESYGGTGEEDADSVVQTKDGGYVLAGLANSFGAGGFDAWVVKADSDGNMEWNQTYGGMDFDSAHMIVETIDGGYAVVGYTESFGAGNQDSWLIKIDNPGKVEWDKTYGGENNDVASSLIRTKDDGYVLVGFTESYGAGSRDLWLVKTDIESGLALTDSSKDTVTLYRGETDAYWNYVRIRIWKPKP